MFLVRVFGTADLEETFQSLIHDELTDSGIVKRETKARAAGKSPKPETRRQARSMVRAQFIASASVAYIEHAPGPEFLRMLLSKPLVAASANRVASNWPTGWKKKTAATMRARYFVGANLPQPSFSFGNQLTIADW